MWFQIFFTFVCLIAVIVITAFTITDNKDYNGKIAPGWWIVDICISQIFLVAIFATWWREWWEVHQWLMNISAGLTVAGVILLGIAKICTKHH